MAEMVDIVTREVRSKMMAGIRNKDTQPEMQVRRFLHSQGLRYRLHSRNLLGKPDLVFPRHGVVLFVNGCYWHRHRNCRYATNPSSNISFWTSKFEANVRRDRNALDALRKTGWRVIVLWECGLRKSSTDEALTWLPGAIRSGRRKFIEWPKVL